MSNEKKKYNLGLKLIYHSVVPIHWAPVDESQLTEQYVERICSSNEKVMHAYAALDDKQELASDDVAHGSELLQSEMLALDQKVNFLLDMVSELLFIHHELPDERAISLTSRTLEWVSEGESIPEVGQRVLVKVYLSRVYMRSFQLFGIVEQVDSASSTVKLSYQFPSPYLNDLLEKMIFRYHRRKIAHSKMSGN